MTHYTDKVKYKKQKLTKGKNIQCPFYPREQIDKEHPSYHDADKNFSQSVYKYPYLPLHLGEYKIKDIEKTNVNVLRLLIRENNSKSSIYLPSELLHLKSFILDNVNYHQQYYPSNRECFIYITVRVGTYKNIFYKEASEWHVDGFQGSRIPRHIVEQDIFWSNICPTQFLIQPMFCEGLDPSKFNINDFFNKKANENFIVKTKPKNLYLTTPYNIHRSYITPFKGKRIFLRLNFSPVEIEDPTNTNNPMIPTKYPARNDVRNFLSQYKTNEIASNGFEC